MPADSFVNVDLSKVGTTQLFPLGEICQKPGGKKFVYMLYNEGAGVDGVAGYYAKPLDNNNLEWELTCDADWSGRVLGEKKGAFLYNAMTDGQYGWAQVAGPNEIAGTISGTVSEGGALMPHATTNGAVAALSGSFGSVAQVAVASVAVASGTTVAVNGMRITCVE